MISIGCGAGLVKTMADLINGAFFWDFSAYSYYGLGITENTECQFRKDCPSENGIPMAEVS